MISRSRLVPGLRTLAFVAVAALSTFGLSSTAQAGTIKVDTDTTKYSSADGGEFKVIAFSGAAVTPMGVNAGITGGLFQTFCMEFNEDILVGKSYDWTMSTAAHDGGNGSGGSDPVDARTAYLYTQFYRGTLSDYDYGVQGVGSTGRAAAATDLQDAIWFIEGERTLAQIGGTTSDAYGFVTAAQAAIDNNHWSGIGSVRVLTLTDPATGAQAQDVLFLVPLPSAALLGLGLMSGLGVLGRLRRRRRRGSEAELAS